MSDDSRHFRAHYPGRAAALAWDALRALVELGRANRQLRGITVSDLIEGTANAFPGDAMPATDGRPPLLAERLAYVIPRVGRRLPWRSDCLVQALAARRLLAAGGIASELHIGARKDAQGHFEAHAWLTVGGLVVTGWDIHGLSEFAEFPARSAAS